jgi:glycerol-3-phosphate dehydrogenase
MNQADRPRPTPRDALLQNLRDGRTFDVAVIGGGATGLGVALDAAARGYTVALFESEDFAKGTSSRATKLVHGGVRYLAQGNISLVREALHERATVLRNAPHLAHRLAFVMPCYHLWEIPFYGAGLMMYDALAGKRGLGKTSVLGPQGTLNALPNVRPAGLKGAVKYWDGQFDDARLAIALGRTAAQRGAHLINYCGVTGLLHTDGKVDGVVARDGETGEQFKVKARCIINATGVWVDGLRRQDDEHAGREVEDIVAPSQGVHVVVDREFMPSDHALIIPGTSDGRVLFTVPWLGKVIIGTTDTPRQNLSREPDPFREELDFILRESSKYLKRAPTPTDIRSIWVGLRPLVKPPKSAGNNTKALSREHTVLVSQSGLVTVTGGKWTTYRAMAADVLQHCIDRALLPARAACTTESLALVGAQRGLPVTHVLSDPPDIRAYGDERATVESLPGAPNALGGGLTEAMVRFAARYEYARRVEDVLARRSRLLFLDAALAASIADSVGRILQEETGIDPEVEAFKALTRHYLHPALLQGAAG